MGQGAQVGKAVESKLGESKLGESKFHDGKQWEGNVAGENARDQDDGGIMERIVGIFNVSVMLLSELYFLSS